MMTAFVVFSCRGTSARRPPPDPIPRATPPEVSSSTLPQVPALAALLTGSPRLVIENHTTSDIRLYNGSIVDEEGKLGTMLLWPRMSDCPAYEPKAHVLPLRGVYDLAQPTHAYDGKQCAPGPPLPPGRYVVRLDSGYGAELYASAEVVLPLKESVRLKMVHHEKPPECTLLRARRAARLALSAALASGAPEVALRGCDPNAATCGVLPLPDDDAPLTCTMTLHERLLRVRRPATGDPPKEITSWLDHEIVFAQRAEISRSSSAQIDFGNDRVFLEGVTATHLHEHGGDAAQIGSMNVLVVNTSKRALKLTVPGVVWLSGHSCDAPKESGPRPKVVRFEPKQLPPGKSTLSIHFDARSAYQAHCDVFASQARIQIEGKEVEVIAQHSVSRVEPLRR